MELNHDFFDWGESEGQKFTTLTTQKGAEYPDNPQGEYKGTEIETFICEASGVSYPNLELPKKYTKTGSIVFGKGFVESGSPEPPTPQPQPIPVEENTEQEEANAEAIVTAFNSGEKTITITDGEIKNVTIPADSTLSGSATINGTVANNAHITMEKEQSLTINHTGDEPVNIEVTMPASKTLTLKGKYDNIYINGKGFSGSNNTEISGTVTIVAPEGTTSMSCGGDWKGDECVVYTENTGSLSITNSNPEGDEVINVYAPNATVTMNNTFDEVTATVSDDTLILNPSFHAHKLNVLKGNIIMKGVDINDFCDELNTTGEVNPIEYDVLKCDPGVSNLNADTEGNGLACTVLASGKGRWNLNGYTYTMKRNMETGVILLRNTYKLDIYGPGKFTSNGAKEHYCVWLGGEGNEINIHGGDYEGYTHCLYAEKGTINVYDGTFKLLNADTADRDANGLLKFLCNCYDSSYTSGIAHINIYGGKFYEYNPAVSYSEPGGPVSFVAPGYGVVESEEDGKRVFTVVPID